MKVQFLKNSVRRAISCLLVFALLCSQVQPLFADPPVGTEQRSVPPLPPEIMFSGDLPANHPLAAFQNGIPESIPAFQDIYHTTSQYIIDYEQDVPKTYSVFDDNIPEFKHYIAKPTTEVITAYSIERQELHLEYYAHGKRVRAHVFTGVKLENVDATLASEDGLIRTLPQIYRDANHILWADDQGVRTIHTNFLKLLFGKKPVFVFDLLPAIQHIENGSRFVGIEPFKVSMEPRKVYDITTGEVAKEIDALRTLLINVETKNGAIESYAIHYSVLSDIFKSHLSALLGLLFTISPNPQIADEVILMLKEGKLADKAQDHAALQKLFDVMNSDTTERSLIEHVLKKISENPDVAELLRKYNTKPLTGARNTVDELSLPRSPLLVNLVDPEAMNSWAKGYAASMKDISSSNNTWDEEVAESLAKHTGDPDGVLNDLSVVQGKIEAVREKKLWSRIDVVLNKVLATKAAKVVFNTKFLVIGGALSVEAVNYFTGGIIGASIASFLNNAHAAMKDVLLLDEATGVFAKSASVFKMPFAYVAMAASFVYLNQFIPMCYAVGGMIVKIKGDTVDKVTGFFKYGARLFSVANYPPQKLVWEYILGQRQVYKALDAEMPLKDSFQNPFRPLVKSVEALFDGVKVTIFGGTLDEGIIDANKNEKARMDAEFDDTLSRHMDRQSKSLLLASALVSLQSGDTVDMVTLHNAFLKKQGGLSIGNFLNNIDKELPPETWKVLQLAAYRELKEIESRGADSIDLTTFVESFQKLTETSKEIIDDLRTKKSLNNSKSPARRAVVWMEDACSGAKTMFSKSVWIWLFFGHQGYKFHKKYKYIDADPRNVSMARHAYEVDYSTSLIWFLLADAKNAIGLLRIFSGDIGGGVSALSRHTAIMVEQSAFYGLKGLIDQEMNNPSNGRLQDPNSHPLDALNKKYAQRTETLARSLSIMLQEVVDPHSPRSISVASLNRTAVVTEGVAANFWAGFLPKFLLNPLVMGFSFAGGISGYLMSSFAAAPQQMIAMFNKLCVGYAAISGTALFGYVMIWPFIVHWNNVIKDEAERNAKLLNSLSEKIWNAAQEGKAASVEAEIKASIELFKSAKTDISFINLDIHTMNPDDMRKLAIALRIDPPLANNASTLMIRATNSVGALVSSVLLVGLFDKLFGPHTNLLYLSIDTALALTGTWMGTKYLVKPMMDYLVSFRKKALPTDPDSPRYPTKATERAMKELGLSGCKAALGK
ncbi:MAG: hypothetical protein R3A80_11510 [Bdellovibrionota bacterium]